MSAAANYSAHHARTSLYERAMQASITTRRKAGVDFKNPICVYALSDALGVKVRFNAIDMEGMYDRSPNPRIHLSALRPLVRRNFNCAHELGHHVFGHGSTIDELREDAHAPRWDQPNEVLADAFAGFLLMPTLGLRHAFAKRRISPQTATPVQIFAIACNFGVGMSTLVTHMTFTIETLSQFRRSALKNHTPKSIRTEFLGQPTTETLILVDEHWTAPSLDAEEGCLIWLPKGVSTMGKVMVRERDVRGGTLHRAIAPGIGRAMRDDGTWSTYVRVSRREYVGLAQYRHLEDVADD